MFPVRYGRRNFFNLLSTCFVRGLLVGIWLVDALQCFVWCVLVTLSPIPVTCVGATGHVPDVLGCGVVWCGWGKPSAY